MGDHRLSTFWADTLNNKGYGWACTCGARVQTTGLYGTPEAALHAGENIHIARYQSEEEINAKRQEEHYRIRARSKEILDRFVA